MKKVDLKEIYSSLSKFANKEITLGGWVRSVRDMKNFAFMDLNDGTSFKGAQVVLHLEKIANYDEVCKMNAGSSVVVKGKVVLTPANPQPFEIEASYVEIQCATDETYPLQKKRHTTEYLREQAYLRPRTNLFNAVFRIRSEVSFAIHSFFNGKGFVYTQTPIITAADCEGGSDVFRITTHNVYDKTKVSTFTPENDFFGKPVFLTPTGQLEGEALALAFGKIYTFGPTFRSENSNTARHASEFWMIEPEVAFNDLKDNMDLIEEMVKYLINHLFVKCSDELEFLNKFVENGLIEKLKAVVDSDFGRISYTEAVKILEQNNEKFEFKAFWGCDLQSEHERYLCEKVFNKPIFVTDYPTEIKAFYMRKNDDGKTVAACDLLVPGVGEMVGGSQREERLDVLLEKIKTFKLKEEDYWWYINLRKFGGVVHSGFGLGLERFLMYATGVSNIRDVQIFSRTPKNCLY
ncbi:MAG: asparagine--tRNA ligase [Clostridia bacterium]